MKQPMVSISKGLCDLEVQGVFLVAKYNHI